MFVSLVWLVSVVVCLVGLWVHGVVVGLNPVPLATCRRAGEAAGRLERGGTECAGAGL